ncbi:MAG: membrane protein insertase YidC, partial [Melioribacteraceae bacterium]|nr:membrane protein insertase YidC [Melioribacteraceae bacterium]
MNAPDPPTNQNRDQDTTVIADKPETPPIEQELESNTKESQQPSTQFKIESEPASEIPERIITIETDLALMELTTKGARIKKFYLKDYKSWYYSKLEDTSNFYISHVQLINTSREGGDFNLVYVTKDGALINTKSLDFESSLNEAYYRIKDGDSLTVAFTYKSGPDKSLTKQFVFYGNDYNSSVDVILDNMDDIISSYRYDLEWSTGINFVEENSVDEANYSNAAAFSGDEKVVIDASSEGETVEKSLNGKIDWIGVRNKYFTVIIAPVNPSPDGGADFKGTHIKNQLGDREYYSSSLRIPFNNQNFQKDRFSLYIGPLEYNILKDNGNNYEAIFEFGSFLGLTFITRPISEYLLLPLFKFLHKFIPNYGWVIIVFSIILKFALYPLTKQSYKSMKRMSQLQPKIAELKEKYKGDQQKIQKETMKLYSTYGVNPAGGCLPMLLQMPVWVALYRTLWSSVDLYQQSFLWLGDLTAKEPLPIMA